MNFSSLILPGKLTLKPDFLFAKLYIARCSARKAWHDCIEGADMRSVGYMCSRPKGYKPEPRHQSCGSGGDGLRRSRSRSSFGLRLRLRGSGSRLETGLLDELFYLGVIQCGTHAVSESELAIYRERALKVSERHF